MAPVGADKAPPRLVYRQTHQNALSRTAPSRETLAVLRRFDQLENYAKAPDSTIRLIHHKAVESHERGLLYALSELNYLAGERLSRSVKPWEPRDARQYYLASAMYAWFFLFGAANEPVPGPFDERFRAACDFYNYALGWAITERRGTNAVAVLSSSRFSLPVGNLELDFKHERFPWALTDLDRFVVAQQFLMRGLSVRNRRAGLGAPLIGVAKPDPGLQLSRCIPATVLLRIDGQVSDVEHGACSGSLELYSGFDTTTVKVDDQDVPLETDTTIAVAYALNQSLAWHLGMMQFLSFRERIPSDVYMTQPYQPGKIPVVFVHGTFSSPVRWAEMINTLSADIELQKHCQFWWFIYNSGLPTHISAVKLRDALSAKIKELDPDAKDPTLQRTVVVGHSQGGLLAKLTATDTGEKLLQVMLNTNRLEDLKLTPEQEALVRRYTCYEALPFVDRVIFISTPHRGSYLATSFARRLGRRLVSLPSRLIEASKEFAGFKEKIDLPKEFKGATTSLDSMSPRNPLQLALADIPLSAGVKGHSIIAVKGNGDFHKGKDGLVIYESAHVSYVQSEFIVRGPHSCQDLAPTIEEVRRILREHIASSPTNQVLEEAVPR